jgi:hypothetical protein
VIIKVTLGNVKSLTNCLIGAKESFVKDFCEDYRGIITYLVAFFHAYHMLCTCLMEDLTCKLGMTTSYKNKLWLASLRFNHIFEMLGLQKV